MTPKKIPKRIPKKIPKGSEEDFTDHTRHFKLYVLADKLQDAVSANLVVNDLIRRTEEEYAVPNEEVIQYAYAHSVASSRLRKLMVDYYVHNANGVQLDLEEAGELTEFLVDVVNKYLRIKAEVEPDRLNRFLSYGPGEKGSCHYHQHDNEHPPCAPAKTADVQKDWVDGYSSPGFVLADDKLVGNE